MALAIGEFQFFRCFNQAIKISYCKELTLKQAKAERLNQINQHFKTKYYYYCSICLEVKQMLEFTSVIDVYMQLCLFNIYMSNR